MNAYLVNEQVDTTRDVAVVVPTRQRDEQTVVRVIVMREVEGRDGSVSYTTAPVTVGSIEEALEYATWEDAEWQ